MSIKVSIIVPVYNVENYLKQCLDSILNQSLKEIEVIVINDGSTDRSGSICDDYSKKDNRIKVCHTKNNGLSAARNKGLELASGEYIGFVDSDDYIRKDMIKNLYDACKVNSADIGVCNISRNIQNYSDCFETKILDKEQGLKECFNGILYRFSPCNKIYRKECFEGIKFPEGRIHEDLSTTYKIFSNANKTAYINYIGYIYFERKNSILTKKFSENRLQSFLAWDEILEFMLNKYPKLEREVIACFGYWCIDYSFKIINGVNDKFKTKEYLNVISKSISDNKIYILRNKKLRIKEKIILAMIYINPAIFVNYINLKKKVYITERA